jgi:hypothetical protein
MEFLIHIPKFRSLSNKLVKRGWLRKGSFTNSSSLKNHCSLLYMERQPLPPSLPDVGDVGVLRTFNNIPAAAAAAARITRNSQDEYSLFARAGGTVRHYRRCGPPFKV